MATSSSNFQFIFNNALKEYERKTKKDLLAHPLAAQLQACSSPTAILAVLQQQVQQLDQSQTTDDRLTRWLDPTINVLYAFSGTLGEGVGLVFSPAKAIFVGVGVLLSTAIDVRASRDTLADIFERMDNFFRRLSVYTEVPPTAEMTDINIKIMIEVLSILAIATKEIKQGRTKKYLKRLIGRTDIEDGLKRLDKLTEEEARMATAQVLKVMHTVDGKVGVVDDSVARVNDRVAGVDDRVRAVDNTVAQVIQDGKEANVVSQQTANDVDQMKRNQLRESLRKWLSPPDPSTNHNIAYGAHHKGTATWFFRGDIFEEWKSTGSLLWIHGKPGSGKTILCSTIIQDIEAMCEAKQVSISYFYFDFRDTGKQHLHDLVTSLLTQLSAGSSPRCDILSRLYSAHDSGARQPSDNVLTRSLKEMLTLPGQCPVYLIMDAIDECPNTSGIPSPRERVLQLIKDLINLHLPNFHICVTSRPEIDIRHSLEPLTSLRVSLHDQGGQKEDIANYVRSIVYSESEAIMRRWRTEDKELVIETLSERADGMFRWAFCLLEILRHCLPPSVRRTLSELPESLDETYERILREIKKPNRDHARRLLQCLVVAIRPLRVEELVEVLAVDFDDAEGIPRLNPSWRWEDEEQALLSSCSSLITIVNTPHSRSRLVQFSHFSVKEFLTSPRLATSSGDASRYHIVLEPAHTILAQASLSVLLQADDIIEKNSNGSGSPLAPYAAEYWVTHAQFRNVSSRLRKAMEFLFDPDKPYFVSWILLHDIDIDRDPSPFLRFTDYSKSDAVPLYYAALCGFQDVVEHLIVQHPQHVNASGGYYMTPVMAALAGRHFQLAHLLHRNGSSVDLRGLAGWSPLHSAAHYEDPEMVGILLEYKADVNAQEDSDKTPLHAALQTDHRINPKVIRLLLEHGADPNARVADGEAPLHQASQHGSAEVAQVLLDHGADPIPRMTDGETPLHCVAQYGSAEVARVLLEHSVSPNVCTTDGETALHRASQYGKLEVVHLLLGNGANPNAQMEDGETPLHRASQYGRLRIAQLLIERGVDPNVRATDGETPLHRASQYGKLKVARLLFEHGADSNSRATDGETPLHRASQYGQLEVARLLFEHGTEANARATNGETPLHRASRFGKRDVAHLLLEHGVDPNVRMADGETPLHLASRYRKLEIADLLFERGADPNAQTTDGETPLHQASQYGRHDAAHLLLEHGADPSMQRMDGETPLHRASQHASPEVAHLLLERGADPNSRKTDGETPLHRASRHGRRQVAHLLLEHGANPNSRMADGESPLHRASRYGRHQVVQLLLQHGADQDT